MQTARTTGPVIPTQATVGDKDIILVITIIIVITAVIGTDADDPLVVLVRMARSVSIREIRLVL
jgi:hypothetical protein